jgi:hypothetical protein
LDDLLAGRVVVIVVTAEENGAHVCEDDEVTIGTVGVVVA